MFYTYPVLLVVRRQEVPWTRALPDVTDVDAAAIYCQHASRRVALEMPTYVVDHHTRRGRKLKRSVHDFVRECAQVSAEDTVLAVPAYQAIYNEMLAVNRPKKRKKSSSSK